MTHDDYLILLIETALGTAVFYALLTVAGWGTSERVLFGAAFVAIMFTIEQRGMWADEQHRQVLRMLTTGFSTNNESFSEELASVLKQSRFERETGLLAFGIFTLVGRYALWFALALAIQRFGPQ